MRTIEDYIAEVAEEDSTTPVTINDVWECDPDAFAMQVVQLMTAPYEEHRAALYDFRYWLVGEVKKFHNVKLEANRRMMNDKFYDGQ